MSASLTTIQVQFTDPAAAAASNAHLSAEIDDRPTGLNAGKTSFVPGDTVGILVYKSDNVSIDSVDASAGSVSLGGGVTVTKEQDITFAGTDTSSISVPAISLTSTTWMGRSLGTIALTGTVAKVSTKGVGIAKVSYLCSATTCLLTSPTTLGGETSFSVVVLITGSVI